MGKTDQSGKQEAGFLPPTGSETILPHVQNFWQAQNAALGEAETFAKRWFERRRMAVQSAIQATDEIARRGTEIGAAQSILQDWQLHSLERMAEDASDWMTLWRNCANFYSASEIDAEAEVIEMASKGKRKLPTRIPV